MPCHGATCGMRPNRMGVTGLLGRRTGDVPPAEMGGLSPQRVLRLDAQHRGSLGLAIVACLFWRSCRCMSLPIFKPEVGPPVRPVTS
jgi:hypothetical protein